MSGLSRFVIARAVSVVLGLTGCGPREDSASATALQAASTVAVAQVTSQSIKERVEALGSVTAWQEIALSGQIGNLAVIDVRVGENDPVKAGDVLVRLDDRSLNAQIAQQRAAIEEAEANLESSMQKVTRADALIATQAISKETADDRRTSVKTSRAKLAYARASLDQLQTQLAQTWIVAPCDGVVVSKPVTIGTVVGAGTELVRLIRESRLEVEAKVPEAQLRAIQKGQIVHLRDPGGREVNAQVRDIAGKVDLKTRMGIVYVSLPEQTGFRPGMFARVGIDISDRQVLTVPEQAVIWQRDKPSVFVLDESGRARLTAVTTGARTAGAVEVRNGLKAGDVVIETGAGFVNDGDKVRIAGANGLMTKSELMP